MLYICICVPLMLFLIHFWSTTEDLTNLTASDVMNRVNLGYLQGKQSNTTILQMYTMIHKSYTNSVADEQNDHQNTLSYVLINPSPDTRLELNDIV